MKILHVINSLNTGGAEKLLLETLPIYNRTIDADILLLSSKASMFRENLISLECCNIYSLTSGSIYNPMLIFKIIPFLKKYDLVHGHLFPSQYWLVLAKIFSHSKTPIVFTEHNTNNRRMGNKLFSFIDRRVYKYYNHIVCITDEIKNILLKYTHLGSNKFTIIHNGVPINKIREACSIPRKSIWTQLSADDIVITQVSAFRPQKDHETLIRAINILPSNYKLLLVGDGILISKYKELVRELALENRICFLGNRSDVFSILRSSDIIVLSTHYEGLSLSCIEAMACGKPFIASDVPGVHKLVHDAGVLFQERGYRDLASKISSICDDTELYHEISLKCMSRANEFCINKMVDSHLSLYKAIL